jgi:hypothetical protein
MKTNDRGSDQDCTPVKLEARLAKAKPPATYSDDYDCTNVEKNAFLVYEKTFVGGD